MSVDVDSWYLYCFHFFHLFPAKDVIVRVLQDVISSNIKSKEVKLVKLQRFVVILETGAYNIYIYINQ